MKAAWESWLRSRVPAWRPGWWRRRFGWRWIEGDYATWVAARAACRGYDHAAELARVLAAARASRRGEASWDRDGFTFTTPAAHEPLLAALRAVAGEYGRLDVVDVGGALGSTWWQHRSWLPAVPVSWRIVDQPAWVEAGQREFADDVLSFHLTVAEAAAGRGPNVALLSSVLPYVESPIALLKEIVARRFPHLIVDRTGFVAGTRDRLAIQRVPPTLGGGSYPCWLFAPESLFAILRLDYLLVAEWPGFDQLDRQAEYRGFHWRRKPPSSPSSA
jgi:putative methyltransferase (TIGR04325 family)